MPERAITTADLIIAHGYVVTMDPQRQMYMDGAVAIADGRIVAVGDGRRVLAAYEAPHIIEAAGMLVLPGLVDGHNHPTAHLAAGSSDDVDVETAVFQRLYPYERHLRPEEAYIAALGTFAEMIKSGTTCFNDASGYDVNAVGEAARVIGIRGILSRSTRDLADPGTASPTQLTEDLETNLREGEAVVRTWNGAAGGRLRAWFAIRNVLWVSDELCLAVKQLADQYGVGIHSHVAWNEAANTATVARFGKRGLARYYDLGLFGPRLYLAHMGGVNERELFLLKQHDVKVAHCPTASMNRGMGVIAERMIPRMVQEGVCVSLGSDTAGASGFLDMVRVMYVAACAHKDAYQDPALIGAYKALEMATIDGARACLWDGEIGSLEVGKRADLVLIDRAGLEWAHPGRDPVRSLVYSATGHSVDTVIIDGRIVMRKRVLLTLDEEHLKREITRAGTAVLKRAGLLPTPRWPVA